MLLLLVGTFTGRQVAPVDTGISTVLTNKKAGYSGYTFTRKRFRKLMEEREREIAAQIEAIEKAKRDAEEKRLKVARDAAEREVRKLREFAESLSRQEQPIIGPSLVRFDDHAEMAARAHKAALDDEDDAIAMLLLHG